jgi:hypothetical protein
MVSTSFFSPHFLLSSQSSSAILMTFPNVLRSAVAIDSSRSRMSAGTCDITCDINLIRISYLSPSYPEIANPQTVHNALNVVPIVGVGFAEFTGDLQHTFRLILRNAPSRQFSAQTL